jgi:hypothetical protein
MSAGDQNYSRAAQFKCLSDSTVPLSVWIVPITAAGSRRAVMIKDENYDMSDVRQLIDHLAAWQYEEPK